MYYAINVINQKSVTMKKSSEMYCMKYWILGMLGNRDNNFNVDRSISKTCYFKQNE